MKKTYLLCIAFVLLFAGYSKKANAQGGVAVNTAGAQPDSSAVLDVSSSTKGELMPRMNTAQRNAIINPANGLFIYNTDCNVVNFNAGTPAHPNWAILNSSNALVAAVTITVNPVGAICSGSGVTFTATPNQNNLSPSYQWQVNASNVGTTSATYTTSALNNGDVVTCILATSANCVTGSPATTNPIVMLVNSIPTIIQTFPDSFCSGSLATLTATASAGNINWYPASTGGSSLATSGSYSASGLYATTTFYVDATANGCTTASRTPVTATYYPQAPGQLEAIAATAGTSLNVQATATYTVSPVANAGSYFWNVPLGTITSGQGTDSITVTWDTSGFGSVSVVANNACGTTLPQEIAPVVIAGTGSQTFNYTSGQQTFTVPNDVTEVAMAVYGAQGSGQYSNGALGGYASGKMAVVPGELLYVFVGGQNGFNGGGTGGSNDNGGGESDVRVGGNGIANWVIVAGGGGGGGNNGSGSINTAAGVGGGLSICANGQAGTGGGYYEGGDGGPGGNGTCTTGGATGSSCCGWGGSGGGGGLTSGGAGGYNGGYGNSGSAGTQGQGGNYGINNVCGSSNAGGGGGGYYGGGGAATGQCAGGSGGGGSSWAAAAVTDAAFWGGFQSGNGQVIIAW